MRNRKSLFAGEFIGTCESYTGEGVYVHSSYEITYFTDSTVSYATKLPIFLQDMGKLLVS